MSVPYQTTTKDPRDDGDGTESGVESVDWRKVGEVTHGTDIASGGLVGDEGGRPGTVVSLGGLCCEGNKEGSGEITEG